MAYEPAEIQRTGQPPIKVLFNPTQYSLDANFVLTETTVVGSKPPVQYTSSQARQMSMELLFDTYEQRTDVRDHTNRIYKLVEVKSGDHHPPIVTFAWGKFTFECWLERVNGRFTLFLDSGIPVRATLTVSFKEYIKVVPPLESADHTKTYVLKRGDTLSSIAHAEYGDAATWRPIAAANGIDNPRVLATGQRIVIPPLPERRGSA
jgi:nucleoid-associated protein YgaU